MGMRLLVLHGPNLNLLSEFEEFNSALRSRATSLGIELKIVQSNHEGVLIDALHAERRAIHGVVVNPSGLFGSHALKDALEAVGVPAVEVHLAPARARQSVLKEACTAQVSGKGVDAYLQALERLAARSKATASPSKAKSIGRKAEAVEPSPAKALARTAEAGASVKTLGRKPSPQGASKPAKAEKSLGRGSKTTPAADLLTRALVRQKIADRLSGKLTPAGLATWARSQWMEVERGAPAESGYRDLLEDNLQTLTLSTMPSSRLTDEQLVDMMTQLEE